jgi:uncharacterized membrane protein YfcA
MTNNTNKYTMTSILIILAIGIVAGIFSGFIGIGGGLVIVPCLVYFFGMTQHTAQGTSLAMMLPPIGILAVLNYHRQGMVDWKIAAILCVTFLAGSFLGSKAAISLPADTVKKIFGAIIIAVGMKMIFEK